MNEKRFVFGVDLDGVCGDFYSALRPIAAEYTGVPVESLPVDVSWGLPEWGLNPFGGYQELHRFAVMQRDLFLKMAPMPGAGPVLRRLSAKNVRIRLITNRLFIKYFHQEAVRQTIEWLDRHGIPYWDLCFLINKAAVGADLYVDDSAETIEQLRAQGFRAIVFSNSTNRRVPPPRATSWTELEQSVLRELALWEQDHAGGGQAVSGQ